MSLRLSGRAIALLKVALFAACLLPALRLAAGVLDAYGIFHWNAVSLGPDPVKFMLHRCGLWTLRFLLITLCMTPLRVITGSVDWLRFRRMLGLYAFFYCLLHFGVYLFLDQEGKFGALWQDVTKRPYITLGMLALLLLVPLAATSTVAAQRRLGRRWILLHRLIYPIAILGVWHFWWQVKKDIREPLAYAAVLFVLLGARLLLRRRRATRAVALAPVTE